MPIDLREAVPLDSHEALHNKELAQPVAFLTIHRRRKPTAHGRMGYGLEVLEWHLLSGRQHLSELETP